MAIAKMSRLKLLCLKTDKNKIMNELIKSGSFMAEPASVSGNLPTDRTHLERALNKQAKVAFAVDYLIACVAEYNDNKKSNEKQVKKGIAEPIPTAAVDNGKQSSVRKIIGYDDFYDVAAKEYELLSVCDDLQKLQFARLERKSEISKLQNKLKSVLPYKGFPSKLSILGDGANVSVILCCSQGQLPEFDFPHVAENYVCESGTLACVVVRLADKDKASALLSAAGFNICSLRDDCTPAEICDGYLGQIKELEDKNFKSLYDALGYYKYLNELKILYDVIGQDIEKSNAELQFAATQETFVIEGWIPRELSESICDSIKQKTPNIVVNLSEPKEDEVPPTLVVSKKLIKPYEDITNMYSVPAYHEIDPNPFMAVFFFMFFGIMIGDAGYGLILTIGGLLALRFLKFEKGTKNLIAMFAMGGVAAVFWGILFGGIFGIESVPALWFNPIKEPLMMLGVSIVLGAVQLLTGYALHSAQLFREHKPLDAIFDSIFIFILFGGLACLALSMLIKTDAPLNIVGLVLIGVSLLGILCTAGRHNKGVLSKIMGGFSGLYGLVNLLSDLLSYARLFGLGLASGAIAMAFNQLGTMLFNIPFVGYVIGIIILIPLHAFNLGIGVLGAYVHNARLQFLEFYGKFYAGDGRMFAPMGEKSKYVRFN